MRETGIHAESKQSVQSYKCSSGIFTQQGSTVVYKEKQINLHNMESVHTRILTTSSERVPSKKRVPYEKQTLLQEGKCFNCWKTGHMIRDCSEKKLIIDLGGGNSPVNSSNYLKEKFDYDLFLSEAELASEKFDGSISICPLPDDTKVYIPVTWGQKKSLDV